MESNRLFKTGDRIRWSVLPDVFPGSRWVDQEGFFFYYSKPGFCVIRLDGINRNRTVALEDLYHA